LPVAGASATLGDQEVIMSRLQAYVLAAGFAVLAIGGISALSGTPSWGEQAAPAQRGAARVAWQYFDEDGKPVGESVQPIAPGPNLHWSVITADANGQWVALQVHGVPPSDLQEKNAESCSAVQKEGAAFRLPEPLRPAVDSAQVVPFLTTGEDDSVKLVVGKDGSVRFRSMGDGLSGKTGIETAGSIVWYAPRPADEGGGSKRPR
jgi:hypothetical protein